MCVCVLMRLIIYYSSRYVRTCFQSVSIVYIVLYFYKTIFNYISRYCCKPLKETVLMREIYCKGKKVSNNSGSFSSSLLFSTILV